MSCLATYLQRAQSFQKLTTHYRLIPLLKAFLSSAAKKKKIHENFNLALFWKSGALHEEILQKKGERAIKKIKKKLI